MKFKFPCPKVKLYCNAPNSFICKLSIATFTLSQSWIAVRLHGLQSPRYLFSEHLHKRFADSCSSPIYLSSLSSPLLQWHIAFSLVLTWSIYLLIFLPLSFASHHSFGLEYSFLPLSRFFLQDSNFISSSRDFLDHKELKIPTSFISYNIFWTIFT